MLRRASCLGLALGLATPVLVQASGARAETRPTLALRYAIEDGAKTCPDEGEVRARLVQEVGYDPFQPSAARQVVLEVTSTPRGFTGVLRDGEAPPRAFEAPRCDDLIESAVLALALSLDPDTRPPPASTAPPPVSSGATPDPPPSPSPPPPSTTMFIPFIPPDAPRPPLPAPEPRSAFFGFWGVGFGVGAGVVPGISAGPTIDLGLGAQAWELALEGTFILPGARASSLGDVVVSSLLFSAIPCYAPRFAAWGRVLLCGNVTLGGHFADAEGVIGTTDPSLELAVFTGPRIGMAIDAAAHLQIRVFAELCGNLTPLAASIQRGEEEPFLVYESPPVAGRTGLSVSFAFP